MPLQLVWAAAAPYCGHESNLVKKHFGHHEHRHQGSVETAQLSGSDAGSLAIAHLDCEACHLGTTVALPGPAPAVVTMIETVVACHSPPSFLSHISSRPERPDRTVRASATRFGGGVAFGLLSA
jgi:hypothetical protein